MGRNEEMPHELVGYHAIEVSQGGVSFVREPREGSIEVTDEMADAVKVCVLHVRKWIRQLGPGARIIVEERARPERNPIHEDCHGTPDIVLISADSTLVIVIDYKHGAGVAVVAEGNWQLATYGVLAVAAHGLRPTKVQLEIVQPRARDGLPPVREWGVNPSQLVALAGTMREACAESDSESPSMAAGDHCRWCPAKSYLLDGKAVTCPVFEGKAIEVAQADFTAAPMQRPPEVPNDPGKLGFILANEEMVKDFLKECRKRATEMAMAGLRVTGHKLVNEVKNRRYKNEEEAREAFSKRIKPKELRDQVIVEKLLPMGQLEKWLKRNLEGRKLTNALKLFNEHVEKPIGGIVLAAESDKREEVHVGAVEDFAGGKLAGLLE